jgi:uncharacterized protein (UPF0335 family)
MTEQPLAMQLADSADTCQLTVHDCALVAKELRRLHAENTDLLNALKRILDEPNNTMSDGKAMKEIIRIARAVLETTEAKLRKENAA